MRLILSSKAWEDYKYWSVSDRKILKRLNKIIGEVMRDPFEGIGKPEPLRSHFKGYWSRRITDEHRLIYRVSDDAVLVAQMRYHYDQ